MALSCLLFSVANAQTTGTPTQKSVTAPLKKTSEAPSTRTSPRKPAPARLQPADIRKILPLRCMAPGQGYEDLVPLKKGLADVRILGAGEGTHGTHEFFTFKHRLFEFLVKEMGYTVFAIEDGIYGSALIQRYITTGEGDPKAILQNEFHDVFQVRELLDLVEWMRGYNATHDIKLTFTGFDCQQLDAYVRGIREVTEKYQFTGFLPLTGYIAPENDSAWQAYIETRIIADSIAQHMPARPVNIPEKEWELAVCYLQNIQAGLHQFTAKDWLPMLNTRDSMMALNVQRIVTQHPGEKIMLWAHNGHVGSWHGSLKDFSTLGGNLKQRYGNTYQSLGFSTGSGKYRARSGQIQKMTEDNQLAAPVPGSIELQLHQTGISLLYFSTHALPLDGKLRMIGSIADTNQFTQDPVAITSLFDWLVYADKTSFAQGL